MTESLRKYCEKHDYTVIKEYATLGEERLNKRAIVKDNKTEEKYYLYFDPSRKRRLFTQQKKDYETYMAGNPLPIPPSRGWRNTTLDNRRSRNATCYENGCYHPRNLHNRFGCMWNTTDGEFGCMCTQTYEFDFDPFYSQEYKNRLSKYNKRRGL